MAASLPTSMPPPLEPWWSICSFYWERSTAVMRQCRCTDDEMLESINRRKMKCFLQVKNSLVFQLILFSKIWYFISNKKPIARIYANRYVIQQQMTIFWSTQKRWWQGWWCVANKLMRKLYPVQNYKSIQKMIMTWFTSSNAYAQPLNACLD